MFVKLHDTGLIVFFICLALAGCGASDTDGSTDAAVNVECQDRRPQICTQEYVPVCALRDTGVRCVTTPCPSTERVTYGNACQACLESDVLGYEPGECVAGE